MLLCSALNPDSFGRAKPTDSSKLSAESAGTKMNSFTKRVLLAVLSLIDFSSVGTALTMKPHFELPGSHAELPPAELRFEANAVSEMSVSPPFVSAALSRRDSLAIGSLEVDLTVVGGRAVVVVVVSIGTFWVVVVGREVALVVGSLLLPLLLVDELGVEPEVGLELESLSASTTNSVTASDFCVELLVAGTFVRASVLADPVLEVDTIADAVVEGELVVVLGCVVVVVVVGVAVVVVVVVVVGVAVVLLGLLVVLVGKASAPLFDSIEGAASKSPVKFSSD